MHRIFHLRKDLVWWCWKTGFLPFPLVPFLSLSKSVPSCYPIDPIIECHAHWNHASCWLPWPSVAVQGGRQYDQGVQGSACRLPQAAICEPLGSPAALPRQWLSSHFKFQRTTWSSAGHWYLSPLPPRPPRFILTTEQTESELTYDSFFVCSCTKCVCSTWIDPCPFTSRLCAVDWPALCVLSGGWPWQHHDALRGSWPCNAGKEPPSFIFATKKEFSSYSHFTSKQPW